jgi:hypothetical protein
MENAVIKPSVIVDKIEAYVDKWMEALFLHNRVPDIPVVMINHLLLHNA